MAGRDPNVGWCRVICDNGEVYFFPRDQYARLTAMVGNRVGYVEVEDVYGAQRYFRIGDIGSISDCPPEALKLEMLAEAEDE